MWIQRSDIIANVMMGKNMLGLSVLNKKDVMSKVTRADTFFSLFIMKIADAESIGEMLIFINGVICNSWSL